MSSADWAALAASTAFPATRDPVCRQPPAASVLRWAHAGLTMEGLSVG